MEEDKIIPPFPYRLFFLYIEPISALLGAFYAGRPAEYLALLTLSRNTAAAAAAASVSLSPQIEMALYQLANLYLLFALNEHIVLSSTTSHRTWRRFLFCLLIADFGHLTTMAPLGPDAYWKVWEWNASLWGNVAMVYVGASMRLAFLSGVGMGKRAVSSASSSSTRTNVKKE